MIGQNPIPTTKKLTSTTERLQSQIQGKVITPQDPSYDQARQAWNLLVDQHPAVIVIPESAEDIVQALRHAHQEGLKVAIQATGHGVVRPADGSMLIITSQLNELHVDAASQTARIGAGLKWGAVLEKTGAFGLAPLLGSSPDVGAVGYTLGGGFGWLGRKYGLSVDSVKYFEVVTPDGQVLRASSNENSDLFWGLRGGGGNFGVVTSMEIQLYPVSTVYGGNLIYPIEDAREVFLRYRDWITDAPDELTSSIVIMNFPPLPVFPEPLRGQTVVMVRGCWCGPIEQGEARLQTWRDWKAPMIDDFKTMPFTQVATISNDPVDPMPGMSTGVWMRELSDEAIDVLIRYGASKNGSSPLTVTEVRLAGGVISRVDPNANAYGNRDASLLLQMIGMTPTPEAHRGLVQYTDQFKRDLEPYLTGGVYINFLEGEGSRMRTKDAYSPQSYRRLQAIKAKYDPQNTLCHGFDVPPLPEE